MKTIRFLNKIRYHLITIVPMAPFTPKSTPKLRSALHFRYSIHASFPIANTVCFDNLELNPSNHYSLSKWEVENNDLVSNLFT